MFNKGVEVIGRDALLILREIRDNLEKMVKNGERQLKTADKAKMKVWTVKDREGKTHEIQAETFNYINGNLVWFFISDEKVASFDDPIFIK